MGMGGPTTVDEARAYRYGKWAGNPKGQAYAEGHCVYEVFPPGRGANHRQCDRRVPEGVAFCRSHDPQRAIDRDAARTAKRSADAEIVEHGDTLLKRLGVTGSVAMHHSRFEHVRNVTISFVEIERLLDELGR